MSSSNLITKHAKNPYSTSQWAFLASKLYVYIIRLKSSGLFYVGSSEDQGQLSY